MKKIIYSILLLFVAFFAACEFNNPDPEDPNTDPNTPDNPKEDTIDFLDIYSLNDFHGGLDKTSDHLGISYISNYLNAKKAENPDNTIILAAGDMYQGSAISNYYYGKATMECMNTMGFDAMVIGNHEFDWGIEEITKYHDGDSENGEANFPLLAANIVYKGTNNEIANTVPYTILTRGQYKVGIIGTIGYGLESDILAANVENYEFLSPVPIIEQTALDLRTKEDVDYVICITHDNGDYTNERLASLRGDARIDAVVNGHYHANTIYAYSRGNSETDMPTIQSGSYGQYVGHIRLNLNEGSVTSYTAENIKSDTLLNSVYEPTDRILQSYHTELDDLVNVDLGVLKYGLTKSSIGTWISDILVSAAHVDFAFQNPGGVKSGALSSGVSAGQVLTSSKLFDIMPHDNVVKTCTVLGADLESFLSAYISDGYFSSNVTVNGGTVYINGEEFSSTKYYTFATNDYVFDQPTNPFVTASDVKNTGILIRDLMQAEVLLQVEQYQDFDIRRDVLIQSLV